ncbi:hypothetical protein M378DRAFT_814098 [Amanita muscaria Koide BX008]|uniref:Mur ligase n=1 Tax=Amanita muscaria (strain Koide BX008) TaxID=946122 RepID=A0A0C2SFR1_AMAMK|nr:hypothetical protein M378DRAFT_814098 [Amanita muscaria Koide BX008]
MSSIDLSLVRLQQLVQHLPLYTRPTIHIAGTNGKGSVSAYLSHILASSQPPFKVGRYNSPHLVVVHDCITIDNKPITPGAYNTERSLVEEADKQHETALSSFELLTLTAFQIFEREKVDVAVVEVGMGGRLDATNILPTSVILASALTAVDLDHQAFLGPTVAHIAKEKANIARPGRPFIIGRQKHPEVDSVVQDVVAEQRGILLPSVQVSQREWDLDLDGEKPIFSLDPDKFEEPPHLPISCHLPCFNGTLRTLLPLFGDHQLDNLGIALGVISSLFTHVPEELALLDFPSKITLQSIGDGIRATRWPGRLSFHTIDIATAGHKRAVVLLDGAHNSASSQTLSDYLVHIVSTLSRGPRHPTEKSTRALPPSPRRLRLTYILALSHSPPKTPLETLSPLLPFRSPSADHSIQVTTRLALLRFTPPDGMPWVKSVSPSELRQVASLLAPDTETWVASEAENENSGEQGCADLSAALKWAVDGRHGEDDNLVVLAGSLYLVADFYRLHEIQ